MKTLLIILAILSVLFIASQVLIKRLTNKTEEHEFTVLNDYGSFQIRKYKAATFSYTVMKAQDYKTVSGTGFRRLAGYIFGRNEENQKIAMTSPVSMTMSDSVIMKFKIPEGLDLENLPKPLDPNVRFQTEQEKIVAAIRFGGHASDRKIEKHTNELKSLLSQKGISHTGEFSFLGYNPPYDLINRRNEIIVEVRF